MKNLLFWMVLIVGTVALLGSCAKKEESTTAAAAAAAGVCTTCDPLTSTTDAEGSITVGSVELSGKYATSCFTNVSDFSSGVVPSDTKSYGFLFIVTGNDNISNETNYYTDSTCKTAGYKQKQVYDNVTVGSASGSEYLVAQFYKLNKLLVTTTVAKTWLEAIYETEDFVLDTEKIRIRSGEQQQYNLWNVSATTFKKGFADDSYPEELDGPTYTKQ